jgi:hypothetical protein
MSEKWATHEEYKSSRKAVLTAGLGAVKGNARGKIDAAVSEKDLRQVSGVKGKSESTYAI